MSLCHVGKCEGGEDEEGEDEDEEAEDEDEKGEDEDEDEQCVRVGGRLVGRHLLCESSLLVSVALLLVSRLLLH